LSKTCVSKTEKISARGCVTCPQERVAPVRRFLQPIGWLWGHPMGTEHREWSGENNECEYTYDLSSKQKKKL